MMSAIKEEEESKLYDCSLGEDINVSRIEGGGGTIGYD